MAAPPNKTELVDVYPNPSTGVFKAGLGKFYDYVKGLLGSTGNSAEARDALGIGSAISFRNLLINGNFVVNQRNYASGTNTTGANQYTLDRWRVITSGQNMTFGAASPDRTVTVPAGGVEQVIEGAMIVGGIYTLSWTGTATATVNGTAIANGGNTASLSPNANVTVRFSGGTVGLAQFEQGTVATPFERRPIAYEETLCKRYFQVVLTSIRQQAINAGQAMSQGISFPVVMRATPTVTNFTAGSALNATGSQLNVSRFGFQYDIIAGAVGDSFVLNWYYSATAEL